MAKITPIDIIKGIPSKLVADTRKNTSPRTSAVIVSTCLRGCRIKMFNFRTNFEW